MYNVLKHSMLENQQKSIGGMIVMKAIKKLFKLFFIGLGVIIVIAVIATFAGGDDTAGPKTPDTDQKDSTEASGDVKKDDVVTKENYDKIKAGDTVTGEGGSTLEEVVALLGEPSTKSESDLGDGNKMMIYNWSDLWGEGTMITVTFINDKVSGKSWIE